MKKVIFPMLAALMTIGVVMSAPSLAQDGQKGMMGRNMPSFADCDLNGDGTIQKVSSIRLARNESQSVLRMVTR